FDRVCPPEHAVEPRASAPDSNDGEVSGPRVAEALPVDDERNARREERLADDELAARGDLDDPLLQAGELRAGGATTRADRRRGLRPRASADCRRQPRRERCPVP